MSLYSTWYHPYPINEAYNKRVAYFCMEYAIHQALKNYSGGLGYLAGSHMRSAFDLRQNMIGIGILWKYGYYDQVRNHDQTMGVLFQKRFYSYLEYSGIAVTVMVHGHPVLVKALVLKPEIFGTVPIYFLTTDLPENDHLARTITHKLYDSELSARIAQSIILGIAGAKVVEALGGADLYHLNEGHGLPAAFYLYEKYRDVNEVKKRLVFTTHTPEKAGNEEHDIEHLNRMGFFGNVPLEVARKITGMHGHLLDYTLSALRLSHLSNGVSKLHGEVARKMWYSNSGVCEIKSITNAQNVGYWADPVLKKALLKNDDEALWQRKVELKKQLFEVVADQTGKLFDPNILTIVWARRFAGYKRADLLLHDLPHFLELITRPNQPVQVIWAGKPYPFHQEAIEVFNKLVKFSYQRNDVAVLAGYELDLSAKLKRGADIWLNNPRRPREASGTSGMTAAMNGAINFSVQDGWVPEFARHGENSFLFPIIDTDLPEEAQDKLDHGNMMQILENEIIPMYYTDRARWIRIMKQSMLDVVPEFGADRMADEYYRILYR